MKTLPKIVGTLLVAVIDESAQRVDWQGTLAAWIDVNRDGLEPDEIKRAVATISAARCFRTGGGAAPAMMLAPILLGRHLDKKWRDDSPDQPPCALCEQLIKGTNSDGEEITAVRVFWSQGQEKEMAFHPACFACVTFP